MIYYGRLIKLVRMGGYPTRRHKRKPPCKVLRYEKGLPKQPFYLFITQLSHQQNWVKRLNLQAK